MRNGELWNSGGPGFAPWQNLSIHKVAYEEKQYLDTIFKVIYFVREQNENLSFLRFMI